MINIKMPFGNTRNEKVAGPIGPIRVLQLIPSTSSGGIESLVLSLVGSMDDRSQFVFDIAALNPTQPVLKDQFERLGATVHLISDAGVGRSLLSKILWRLKAVVNLWALIAAGNYDVLHCHLGASHTPYTLAAWALGIRTRIVHSHQAPPQGDRHRGGGRRRARSIAGLECLVTHKVGCGSAATHWLWGEAPRAGKTPRTIYNGIIVKRFEKARQLRKLRHSNDPHPINLLHVGRFSAPKNQGFLLDVLFQLSNRIDTVHLNIVGYGPLEGELKQRVARLGLRESVTFHDQQTDVVELLSETDYFLLPSIREGLPIVAVESQVAGVPIVVSDSVTREIDMGLALFIPLELGAAAWADQIVALIEKQEEWPEPKFEAINRFDIDVIAGEWAKVYSSARPAQPAP